MTRVCNEAFQHDADHGEADEGGDGSSVALEVACQAPEAAEPGKGAFDQRLYNVAKNWLLWLVILVPVDQLVVGPGR